jgi:RimJ/RimL family protein N-acetyltransferase
MISKYGVFLRLVEESDAEFILALRTNPKLKTFISSTSPNLSDQIKWIQEYRKKQSQGLEYYYISQDQNGNKYGTIRLSNIDERSFELGSWVFMNNSPFGIAVKTHMIALEIGFELLKADNCKIRVGKKNKGVLRYIEEFNPFISSEDEFDIYFTLSKENFYIRKNKLTIFSQ